MRGRAPSASEKASRPPSDMAALTRPRPRTSPITLSLPPHLAPRPTSRAGTLLSELEGAKRAQAEAERQASGLHLSLREQEARLLQSGQRVDDANAAMAPLRQQAEHARESVAAFETRLSDATSRLAEESARAAELEAKLLRVSEVEQRQTSDAVAEAEAQLSQVRAEASSDPQRQPESA